MSRPSNALSASGKRRRTRGSVIWSEMPLIVGSYAKVAVEGNEIEIKMECR